MPMSSKKYYSGYSTSKYPRKNKTRTSKKSDFSFEKVFGDIKYYFKEFFLDNSNNVVRDNIAKKLGRGKLVFFTYVTTYLLYFTYTCIFAAAVVLAYYTNQLPNPDTLLERSFELSTKFYDRNGQLLYEVYGEKNRTLIQYEEISSHVVHATLATEDAEFYLHNGYDPLGMIRGAINSVRGKGLQSGSTLTQQVIKNTLLTPEQTIVRKVKELILSMQLENIYTKNQIIQMYLNETPYGGQNYGVVSAAKAYFQKDPKDLSLAESAYIAGLPQSPSVYSYFGANPDAGLERKDYVLYLMKEKGWLEEDGTRHYITEDEYTSALAEELNFEAVRIPLEAPHFVFYVKQYLIDLLGEEAVENGGLKVITSLDLEAQRKAQEIVYDELATDQKNLNVWNGALVSIEPTTGQIIAMVGSKGYNIESEPEGCTPGTTGEDSCLFDPYVNITTSNRQPGSAIKPITYANMLRQGYSVAYPLLDVPTSFEGSAPDKPYQPVNYDGTFRGVMSLRNSLANSLNISAVKALKIGGIENMVQLATNMGITTFDKNTQYYGLAITLGGVETKLLELTGAYSVFANKGMLNKPTPIVEVQDSAGNIIYKPDVSNNRVLEEGVAFLISDVLSDDGARSAAFGTGSLLNIPGHQVAVKTGTTDEKRDNYAVGFTPYIVTGVWVGNNNNEPMNPYIASGVSGATPIWHDFMVYYTKKYTEGKTEAIKFEAPDSVEKVKVDKLTGMKPYEGFDTRDEWFVKGTTPTAISDWYKRIEICKDDGKIANNDCRNADRTSVEDFVRITAERPEWQQSVDAYVKENYDDDKYFPPLLTSHLKYDGDSVSNKDEVYTEIVGLTDNQEVPLEFRLNVEVSAYYDLEKVHIYLDGNKVTEDSNAPFGYNFKFTTKDIGKHEFKAVAYDEKDNSDSHEIDLLVGIRE